MDNLRAVTILIVLAFHSVMAYVQWAPSQTSAFDRPPYGWRTFPILDPHRWFGFDLFCAWQDVYLMSLMFLLSGLFVWPSLQRKRNWGFMRDRLLRLGVPFLFGVIVLVPIAVYPTYRVTAADPSISDYVRSYLALPFVPNGQVWFLWQLLALNVVVVGVNWIAPNAIKTLGQWSATLGQRPLSYLGVFFLAAALAYVPLALLFTPWAWSNSGPLAVQFSRPLLYAICFFAGVGIGAGGIDNGLIAADGGLARRWWLWLAAALATLFLWMGVTSLTLAGPAPLAIEFASDLSFALACVTGSSFLLAASLRLGLRRSPARAYLSANAYSLYLVHYAFVFWMQYALLSVDLPAVVKGPTVFVVALIVSWVVILAVQRIPLAARLIGAARATAIAQSMAPPPLAAGIYARFRQIMSL